MEQSWHGETPIGALEGSSGPNYRYKYEANVDMRLWKVMFNAKGAEMRPCLSWENRPPSCLLNVII